MSLDAERMERAWNSLPGGPEAECPGCREVWQYMGPNAQGAEVFRHRHYPDGSACPGPGYRYSRYRETVAV